jgi:plastocyanin
MLRRLCFIFAPLVFVFTVSCFSDAPEATGPDDGTAAATVEMTQQVTFSPPTVTIRVGERVRWRNTSNLIHTVTADPSLASNPANVQLPGGAAAFHSGNIQPGGEYSRTFTIAGTYRYVCIPHESGGMLGTVVVNP